jgi:hypothetical protein
VLATKGKYARIPVIESIPAAYDRQQELEENLENAKKEIEDQEGQLAVLRARNTSSRPGRVSLARSGPQPLHSSARTEIP